MKRKTRKNKALALSLILTGIAVTYSISDATILLFTLILGVPLFFAKENWI